MIAGAGRYMEQLKDISNLFNKPLYRPSLIHYNYSYNE